MGVILIGGRGNLIHRQTPAGNMYFDYDGENHMVHRAWGANSHAYYSYDADGKRVRIHPHNVTPTVFVYQGPDMLRLQMEKRDNGDTVAEYTIGARGGLEAQRRGEDTSVYHFDMLGSTLALTDADEAVTDTYRYEAWGDVLASTGNTTNRHTWVGRERYIMTRNSDLALLGLRYYMPSIGRFTTRDPARWGRNWMVNTTNRPTRFTDPTGLRSGKRHCDWLRQQLGQAAAAVRVCPTKTDCEKLNKYLYDYLYRCKSFDPRPLPEPSTPYPWPPLPPPTKGPIDRFRNVPGYETWYSQCHLLPGQGGREETPSTGHPGSGTSGPPSDTGLEPPAGPGPLDAGQGTPGVVPDWSYSHPGWERARRHMFDWYMADPDPNIGEFENDFDLAAHPPASKPI